MLPIVVIKLQSLWHVRIKGKIRGADVPEAAQNGNVAIRCVPDAEKLRIIKEKMHGLVFPVRAAPGIIEADTLAGVSLAL